MESLLNRFKSEELPGQSLENQAGHNHLVFDLVIRSLKSTVLIKRCRLVCKSWNESACAVLRQTTSITISEYGDKKLATFKRLQRARKKSENLRLLANPFRKVNLLAHSFTERGFINFIRRWDSNLAVVQITLREQSYKNDPKKKLKVFQDLLILCGETSLESMEFYWSYFSPKPGEFNLEKIKLTKLKHLIINLEVDTTQFFKTIVRHSKLQSLELQFTNSPSLDLGPLNFENIPFSELSIWPEDNKNFSFRNFTKLSLQNVKNISISATDENTDPLDVVQLLSQNSKTLESLEIEGVQLPTLTLPKFPNLKKIQFDNDLIFELDPVKFPLLNDLSFSPSPGFKSGPHFGVQKLCYLAEDFLEEDEHYGDMNSKPNFRGSLMKLGRLFPNVEHLEMCLAWSSFEEEVKDPYSRKILIIIRESFPHLKTLEIDREKIVPLSSDEDYDEDYDSSMDSSFDEMYGF